MRHSTPYVRAPARLLISPSRPPKGRLVGDIGGGEGVQTVREVAALRAAVAALRVDGGAVALVPTMGALHAGHIALVEAAKARAPHVVASIFVNPKQFGAGEDLGRYPRREAADAGMLAEAGCALLWAPDAATMYPADFATSVSVAGLSGPLEGAARHGHFEGVATVVAKLFNQVRPDCALFGEKDFQQLAVVRRMAADLDLGVDVIGVPTQRDDDGLALSSRNAYLTPEQRVQARTLPRALGEAAAAIVRGEDVAVALASATRRLREGGFETVDYVALADAVTLRPITRLAGEARLLAAARIGGARLIDNLAVVPTDG